MPLKEIITSLNWVDISAVCLVLITAYRATRRVFIVEFFKLLGFIFAIYIAMQYFSQASDALQGFVPFLGVYLSDLIAFLGLAVLTYLIFYLIREGLSRMLKIEAVSLLDRWGGLIMGFFRGLLLASMFVFLLNLSFMEYLQQSARKAYLGNRLAVIDVQTYEFIFNNLVAKFSPEEKSNSKNIYEILNIEAEAAYETE